MQEAGAQTRMRHATIIPIRSIILPTNSVSAHARCAIFSFYIFHGKGQLSYTYSAMCKVSLTSVYKQDPEYQKPMHRQY